MNKYNARKTKIDGITFDSKREASRYSELKLLEKAGEIKDLKLQVPFELQPKYRRRNGQIVRAIKYVADFVYTDTKTDEQVIEDVKGMRTEVYKLKKKLFEYKTGEEIHEI